VPPLTLENAAALVPGGVTADDIAKEQRTMQQKPALPQTLKVRVLRAFTDHKRQVLAKDSTAELPRVFALEMAAANKAEILKDEPAPAPAAAKEEKPASDARGRQEGRR
jgi:hypothetical protein